MGGGRCHCERPGRADLVVRVWFVRRQLFDGWAVYCSHGDASPWARQSLGWWGLGEWFAAIAVLRQCLISARGSCQYSGGDGG
eukprot:15465556-Alexandrium_andersonii.AAC.1